MGTWLLTTFANANEVGAGESVANVLLGDLGLVADPGVVAPLWVRVLLNVMGAAVVLGSAAVLFRSPRVHAHARALPTRPAVRTLLRDHGDHDSLGYFATRRDKAVVWDHGDPAQARAGVSYRVVGSVSLASGNPVGDPEHWPAAIEAWRRRRPGERLVARGDGRRGRGGAAAYDRGRPHRLRDRRRGDPRPAGLLAQRPRHEAGAPVRDAGCSAAATRRGCAATAR